MLSKKKKNKKISLYVHTLIESFVSITLHTMIDSFIKVLIIILDNVAIS